MVDVIIDSKLLKRFSYQGYQEDQYYQDHLEDQEKQDYQDHLEDQKEQDYQDHLEDQEDKEYKEKQEEDDDDLIDWGDCAATPDSTRELLKRDVEEKKHLCLFASLYKEVIELDKIFDSLTYEEKKKRVSDLEERYNKIYAIYQKKLSTDIDTETSIPIQLSIPKIDYIVLKHNYQFSYKINNSYYTIVGQDNTRLLLHVGLQLYYFDKKMFQLENLYLNYNCCVFQYLKQDATNLYFYASKTSVISVQNDFFKQF